MKQWYRWNSLEQAQACLDYLNSRPEMPLVGKNAKTKNPEPSKSKTTKWCESVTTCNDGKYGFPRIPTTLLEALNINSDDQQQFLETFNPTVEDFDFSWIPVEGQ